MKVEIYNCEGFEWDQGNADKNWYLHQVTNGECEEIFFNLPLILAQDAQHSQNEQRYYALGRTDAQRWVFVAFAIRQKLIRIISARDMNRKETSIYAKQPKGHTKL